MWETANNIMFLSRLVTQLLHATEDPAGKWSKRGGHPLRTPKAC